MDFDSTCKLIGLRVDPETAEACRYLEGGGQRFCVDFGTENAIERAGAHLIECNPIIPVPSGREFLAASVSGMQWSAEDRAWLRSMEKAFGKTSDTGLSRPD